MIPYYTGSKRQQKERTKLEKERQRWKTTGNYGNGREVENNGNNGGKTREVEQRQSLAVFVCSCHQLAKWQTKKNTRKAQAHTIEIILHWNLHTCQTSLVCNSAVKLQYLDFVKLTFTQKVFFQINFHIESFSNLLSHRRCFQIYFHTESFF